MKITNSPSAPLFVIWNKATGEFEVQVPDGVEAVEVPQIFDGAQLDPDRTGVVITNTKGRV